ncbi:UPF0179 family protein [archaeon]|nr:UPF0179 family protein [archaeon]
MKLTLVDSKLAKVGYEFVNYGEADECRTCKIAKACVNLERGKRYRVTGVRDKEHECLIAGRATVVEVTECDMPAAIDRRKVYPGSKINFEPVTCDNLLCKNMKHCKPEGLTLGDPCKIVDSVGKINCEKGQNLVLVSLKKL